jgi:repressor LexA
VHRGKSRGIQILKLTDTPHPIVTLIPLLGQIAAGPPIFAIQDVVEHISVPTGFLGSGAYFALHVSGESMKDVGINHGDIAIIRYQDTVQDGEIAAVILENDATLKRFYRHADRIVLRSENSAFQDLVVQQNDCLQVRIAGKLTGLLKRMA